MSDKIKDLINNAEKKYGKGSLKFGDSAISNVPIICSSGSIKMDKALGCGGIPQGRIIEYMGNPSGGKSTLAIITMREAQKKYPDKTVAFIDLENSFDREWATNIGLDCDKILFSQPESGEEAFSLIEMMLESDEVSFIVVDSVSGLLTKAQIDADYDQAQMAQLARLMSQALPKINNKLKNRFATVLFISQYRQKLGTYVPTNTTQGGEALKFFASIRAEISRGEVIGEKEAPIGFVTRIKLLKNKVGPPFRKIETELYIGPEKFGIEVLGEIADLAVVNGIVNKTGAWFKYGEERWQGRENFLNFLRSDDKLYLELYTQVQKIVLKKDVPIAGSFNDVKAKEETKIEEKKMRRNKKDIKESEELNIDMGVASEN
jgi:recombination protein RecA